MEPSLASEPRKAPPQGGAFFVARSVAYTSAECCRPERVFRVQLVARAKVYIGPIPGRRPLPWSGLGHSLTKSWPDRRGADGMAQGGRSCLNGIRRQPQTRARFQCRDAGSDRIFRPERRSAQIGADVADPPCLQRPPAAPPAAALRPARRPDRRAEARSQHPICSGNDLQSFDRQAGQRQSAQLHAAGLQAQGPLYLAHHSDPARPDASRQAQQPPAGRSHLYGRQPRRAQRPPLLQRHQPPHPRPVGEPVGQWRQRAAVGQPRHQLRI